jgi:hypothetical protein
LPVFLLSFLGAVVRVVLLLPQCYVLFFFLFFFLRSLMSL